MVKTSFKGMALFVVIPVLVTFSYVTSASSWIPQHGTVVSPILPNSGVPIRRGSVVEIDGGLYRARRHIANENPLPPIPQDGRNTPDWQYLAKGSYVNPKIFGEDTQAANGDIFLDQRTGTYYESKVDGPVGIRNWETSIEDGPDWIVVDEKENWMTLLRDEVGDVRIGDLLLPGSHDTGSYGINTNSTLVDYRNIARAFPIEFIINWSITHTDDIATQLRQGFRQLDLRIADLQKVGGDFHWYHVLSGDDITEGLDQISDFSETHPGEVLILYFQHFTAVNDRTHSNQDIPIDRKRALSARILSELGSRMIPRGQLGNSPTINTLLATGRSIMAIMADDDIQALDDRYWNKNTLSTTWVSVSNTESLFNQRSNLLLHLKENQDDKITGVSGCTTPSYITLAAAFVKTYGKDLIGDLIRYLDNICPDITVEDLDPDRMSFEGLYVSLVTMAEEGTNSAGMKARPSELYTNGGSVHYDGVNAMARHWVARPKLYKPNIIYQDALSTSDLVDTAILAAKSEIPPEVTIAHQGNPTSGYLEWNGCTTEGGTEGLECAAVIARVRIMDEETEIATYPLDAHSRVTLKSGDFPPWAKCRIGVKSLEEDQWLNELPLEANFTDLVEQHMDLYTRGTALGKDRGFAYFSSEYNVFSDHCGETPEDGYEHLIEWDGASSTASYVWMATWHLMLSAFVASVCFNR